MADCLRPSIGSLLHQPTVSYWRRCWRGGTPIIWPDDIGRGSYAVRLKRQNDAGSETFVAQFVRVDGAWRDDAVGKRSLPSFGRPLLATRIIKSIYPTLFTRTVSMFEKIPPDSIDVEPSMTVSSPTDLAV